MGDQAYQPSTTPPVYFQGTSHEPPDGVRRPLPRPYESAPQPSPPQDREQTYSPPNDIAQRGYNNNCGDNCNASGNYNAVYNPPLRSAFDRLRAQRRNSQAQETDQDAERRRRADRETRELAQSNGRIQPAADAARTALSSSKAMATDTHEASNLDGSTGDPLGGNQWFRNNEQTAQEPIANPRRPLDRPVDGLSRAAPDPADGGQYRQQRKHGEQQEEEVRGRRQSNITLGADNFTELAVGGMAAIAYTIAEQSPRESGLHAIDAAERPETSSHSSLRGLNATEWRPGSAPPGTATPPKSQHRWGPDVYTDDPYQSPARHDMNLGMVTPNDIEDDGDDGLDYGKSNQRVSMLSIISSHRPSGSGPGSARNTAGEGATIAMSAGIGATAGAVAGSVANNPFSRGGSSGGRYAPVSNDSAALAHDGPKGPGAYNLPLSGGDKEADWSPGTARPLGRTPRRKRGRIAIIVCIGLAIIAGIVCGVLFGVVFKIHNSSTDSSNSSSAASDTAANGDLSLHSPEIQALLNNKNLHKVFPGIDYTPINTQYPDCIGNPPSPNNFTRDLAVLSQLTNKVRLYGTDCNQTEMLIHSINQLEMKDTVKIWMGVWQDNNVTTNLRQLAQMWDILDHYGDGYFAGIIVANEILFRKQMTVSGLGSFLSDVRTNLTSRGLSLPVATSDLGDNWTKELADQSDFVMANIHPFFAGTPATTAASWTWDFWEKSTGVVFKPNKSQNIISETGWPSEGGTDCGSDSSETTCPGAAVAGVRELNKFMDGWVCDALANGTQYFWFEAFDEPWKIRYDTGNQNWEDHWGLMDVNRNLKDGVQIPGCGGKTVD